MPDNSGLRILVVDQSVVYRRLFSEIIGGLDTAAEVAVAANTKIALARLAQKRFDLVLFDLERGGRQSLLELGEINAAAPDAGLAALCEAQAMDAYLAVKSMEAGALELIPKPDRLAGEKEAAAFCALLDPLFSGVRGRRQAARARRVLDSIPAPALAGARARPASPEPKAAGRVAAPRVDVVAIGVSTGGPNALHKVIPRLPGNIGKPVLLVQHMPPDFTEALAESLNRASEMRVKEAGHGERIAPGVVYIAPGGRHMAVRGGNGGDPSGAFISLNDGPPVNSCRPSADVLFRSLEPVYGGRVLSVVMTGMGNDGKDGVSVLKRAGGYCLSQSEKSCVVYGMPRAVDEAGLSDERVDLENMAMRIADIARP